MTVASSGPSALPALGRRSWLWLWLALALAIAVLYLLPDSGPPGEFHLDKLIHVAAFGAIGFPVWPGTMRARPFAWLLFAAFTLALALECAQTFVSGRSFSAFDILANVVGLGAGTLAGLRLAGGSWTARTLRRSMSHTDGIGPPTRAD